MSKDPNFLKKQHEVKAVVQDELLIRSEIYNKNDFDIVFFRMKEWDQYVRGSGITVGPEFIICKSKEWCILPTSYYSVRAYDAGHAGDPKRELQADTPINVTRNYGNVIGIQNKLPSAPEAEKRHVLRKRKRI